MFIKDIENEVTIMTSIARPKRIYLRGSDGKRYGLLCKPKDDLRKDLKVMEFNNVVNWYLHRNPESRQRELRVKCYGVIPLNEEHGIIEWVPKLTGFRSCILALNRDNGKVMNQKDLKTIIRTFF